ncbi:hypothetical protein [Phenylobacterium sp.]|jgi:hypothetical protein|uniref:hypothetical protein n=1 Tax=Phenylobacterium sp. TaxID=1871053 RepID=UPI002F40E6ED
MRALTRLLLACLAALLAPAAAWADAAPFDLVGPELQINVSRAGQSLPISRTPTLAAGDQLWIKADLPPGQSAHYLLVAAFLRGATNPPPKAWFFQSQTWDKKAAGGMTVTVPAGAQQVLLFLAPETGGDFSTLVNAVRSRPGAFVRAAQDLHQATLDRSRLDAYTAAIRKINETEPGKLKAASPLLARSLSIKLDADCLQKTVELQAPCLVQGRDSMVMADGHATSMVQALTTGYSAELVQQLSYTPRAGAGYYSPYVSSVLDLAHIMDSVRTAHYQYIPTLATVRGERLALLLNAPPSFQDPKSVLVVALPQVAPPDPPPLHPVDDKQAYCAQAPDLVLPVEGAPLIFSTRYGRDLVLRVAAKDGKSVDLPVRPDPERGGLAVDASGLSPDSFGETVRATLEGRWGFSAYKGPSFTLEVARPQRWLAAPEDQRALMAGGDAVVHLHGPTAACVEGVEMQAGAQPAHPVTWSASKADELTLKAPLGKPRPRSLTVAVRQYGVLRPDEVKLLPVDLGPRIDGLDIHAGETSAMLRGSRLKAVTGVTLEGVRFTPGALAADGEAETLTLIAAADARPATAGEADAAITFDDGHASRLEVSVGPPRPSVSLIEKSFRLPAPQGPGVRIALGDKDLAPLGAQLTFSMRAGSTGGFHGDEKVEVAGPGEKVLATLTTASGLVLADSQVAVATLDTGKAFNASVAGPLSFRVVRGGAASHWTPLATLVRLPKLEGVTCPADAKKPCALSGSSLFLIDSLSNSAAFKTQTQVPAGYTDQVLDAPRPAGGKLYLRLHDDPAVVNVVTLTPDGKAAKIAP